MSDTNILNEIFCESDTGIQNLLESLGENKSPKDFFISLKKMIRNVGMIKGLSLNNYFPPTSFKLKSLNPSFDLNSWMETEIIISQDLKQNDPDFYHIDLALNSADKPLGLEATNKEESSYIAFWVCASIKLKIDKRQFDKKKDVFDCDWIVSEFVFQVCFAKTGFDVPASKCFDYAEANEDWDVDGVFFTMTVKIDFDKKEYQYSLSDNTNTDCILDYIKENGELYNSLLTKRIFTFSLNAYVFSDVMTDFYHRISVLSNMLIRLEADSSFWEDVSIDDKAYCLANE